jgi:Flp pilus assembly protein TadD
VFVLAAAGCSGARPGPPGPPLAPRPLLLVTIDTLRADHVNENVTPALSALARESVVFTQAVTVSPLTLPAHASLLTGEYPVRHGVRDNMIYALPRDVPTYAEAFRARGYATGAFVSTIVLDARHGLGRGFDVYDDEVGETERAAAETIARALRWLDAASRPYFLWIHLFEPHAPYAGGSYAAEVTTADAEIGRLLDRLRLRSDWPETVVAVTSDHGEMLGEHGEATHGFFLYEAAVRIPWLLRAPGLTAGRVDDQVRIVDILPTAAALAWPAGPAPAPRDGVNVLPFTARSGTARLDAYIETWLPRHQFGWSELTALRTSRYKLVRAPRPELYELEGDPGETRNLATREPAVAARLEAILGALERSAAPAPRPTASDPLLAQRFMSLGYLGYAPAQASRGASSGLADPKDKLQVYRAIMAATELASAGRLDEALESLDQALALDPDVAHAQFLRGTFLGQEGRFGEAAAALERAVALSPRHVGARFKLALAYTQLGQDGQAEATLRQVLADEPTNARAWHNLATLAYRQRRLAEARALAQKATALEPDYAEAWNALGAIAIAAHRADEAIAALEHATALAPAHAQAFANLAIAYRLVNRGADAARADRRACEIDRRYCS